MIEDKSIRNLAILIKLKSIYSSGCVHNYSPFKLAKSSNFSRNSIKKYVDWSITNGFARMEGNNLIFTDFKKLDKSYKHGFVKIDTSLSIQKIQLLLYRQKIQNNSNEFDYLKKVQIDSTNPSGQYALSNYKMANKAILKLNRNVNNLPSAKENYSVSIKGLAKQFKCSVGKAQGIVNSLCEENLLKRVSNYKRGSKLGYKEQRNVDFKRLLPIHNPGCWISNGFMFKRLPNIYIL